MTTANFNMPDSPVKEQRPLGRMLSSTVPFAPTPVGLHGRTCELQPLNSTHFEHLYEALNHHDLWDYMLSEPYEDRAAFIRHYTNILGNKVTSTIYFAVLPKPTMTPEGMIALMDVNTQHRSLEIGHVIFGPCLQKNTAATEAVYLALNYAFMLGFTRVVWKCNNLNAASKSAATRLGFEFEGVQKRHMVVKKRVRDTAFFAITADTWQPVKVTLEEWLKPCNFEQHERQKKPLQIIREEVEERLEEEHGTLDGFVQND